jgi:hypothetical protein
MSLADPNTQNTTTLARIIFSSLLILAGWVAVAGIVTCLCLGGAVAIDSALGQIPGLITITKPLYVLIAMMIVCAFFMLATGTAYENKAFAYQKKFLMLFIIVMLMTSPLLFGMCISLRKDLPATESVTNLEMSFAAVIFLAMAMDVIFKIAEAHKEKVKEGENTRLGNLH